MVREKRDREKEPLLQREIRDDFHGSTTASLSSVDYDTYIKPYVQTETAVYWYVHFSISNLFQSQILFVLNILIL